MLSQRRANIVFAIFVIVACIYFAVLAEGFEAAGLLASSGLPSKFFPQLMLGFTGSCAAIVAGLYVRRGAAGEAQGATVFGEFAEARRGLSMLAVAIFSYLIWSHFGFLPMAVLMGPLSLLAMGVRSIWIYATVWALTGLVYLVFTQLLNIPLS